MRVRIRQHATRPDEWYVETKHWFEFFWQVWAGYDTFSEKRAIEIAGRLKHPFIVEME